jgi:hypothetical protein
MVLLDGSSYAPETVGKVGRILAGRQLDVLFIDGDHRYEGVKSDLLRYRQFVREGGYILFHDIMPDQNDGWIWSGGVPTLWNEIKGLFPSQEFVDDPLQKGCGIGLIRHSGDVVIPEGSGCA